MTLVHAKRRVFATARRPCTWLMAAALLAATWAIPASASSSSATPYGFGGVCYGLAQSYAYSPGAPQFATWYSGSDSYWVHRKAFTASWWHSTGWYPVSGSEGAYDIVIVNTDGASGARAGHNLGLDTWNVGANKWTCTKYTGNC